MHLIPDLKQVIRTHSLQYPASQHFRAGSRFENLCNYEYDFINLYIHIISIQNA